MSEETKAKKTMIVYEGACMACGYCERVCPTGAIKVTDVAHIDQSLCIGCASCAGRCPAGAID